MSGVKGEGCKVRGVRCRGVRGWWTWEGANQQSHSIRLAGTTGKPETTQGREGGGGLRKYAVTVVIFFEYSLQVWILLPPLRICNPSLALERAIQNLVHYLNPLKPNPGYQRLITQLF